MSVSAEPIDLSSCLMDTPPIPAKKRRRIDSLNEQQNSQCQSEEVNRFAPEKTKLVSVLRNETTSKRLVLHCRFEDSPDKDAIVILEKCPFPGTPEALRSGKVINISSLDNPNVDPDEDNVQEVTVNDSSFPQWCARSILSNDVYHRLMVSAGYEHVNDVNVTVIHPAEAHHFKKYTRSNRYQVDETPEQYKFLIVPYLSKQPRDLSWVDNILNGTAEKDRVVWTDGHPESGFTLVLDFRWNGKRIQEMHCLGLMQDTQLTCLRDLRASHIPLLKRVLQVGRTELSAKYSSSEPSESDSQCLSKSQIMAYIHYPPTFYRLHVHFVHVDHGDDGGTRAGRAHLLDEVIRNLELDGEYYAKRVFSIYLHDSSPMLSVLQGQSASSIELTVPD